VIDPETGETVTYVEPERAIKEKRVPKKDTDGKTLKLYNPDKLDDEYNATNDKVNSAYRLTHDVERTGHNEYVYVDGDRKAITNKEESSQPIPVILKDERYFDYTANNNQGAVVGDYYIEVPAVTNWDDAKAAYHVYAPKFIDVSAVSATWLNRAVGDTMRIPYSEGNILIAVAPYAQEIIAKAKVDRYQDYYDSAVENHKRVSDDLQKAKENYEYFLGHKPGEQNEATKQIVGSFVDVPADEWFAPYIADVVDKGLMKGYADGKHFGTYDQLQRQDFVVILWRMAGSPKVNYAISFKDVDPNAYYADAVRWAASTGVANGYNANEFGVGKNITREDFTVMLHRYNGYPTQVAEISNFLDASKVSGYAEKAVKWAVSVGAITGKNDGTIIDPQAPIARCESAKILSIVSDWTI
jgi:hypothetical protein